MSDIFSVLRADHEAVEVLLTQLEDLPTALSGATPDQLAVRRALAEHLVMEESRHEAAEEQYFWPAVREKVVGGESLAERAIAQETEGKHLLDVLDETSPDNAEFEKVVADVIRAAREHITFEQQHVWPRLRDALPDDESATLAEKVGRAKQAGPTRPHPDTPPKPGVLKSAGMVAAVMDRARDALTNRGDPRR